MKSLRIVGCDRSNRTEKKLFVGMMGVLNEWN